MEELGKEVLTIRLHMMYSRVEGTHKLTRHGPILNSLYVGQDQPDYI